MLNFAQLHKLLKNKQFANTQCFDGFGAFVGMYYNFNKQTAKNVVKLLLAKGFIVNKQQSGNGCLVLNNTAQIFTVCSNGKHPPTCILSFVTSACNN